MAADASLGWAPVIQGKLEIREVPGHQQNILIEPHVTRLAEELAARLNADAPVAPTKQEVTSEADPVAVLS